MPDSHRDERNSASWSGSDWHSAEGPQNLQTRRPSAGRLDGARLLVVEDSAIIFLELEMVLTDAGAVVIGPSRSVADALATLRRHKIDAAILDLRLGHETSGPIASVLEGLGTPFLFYTGQPDGDPDLEPWRGRHILRKPTDPKLLVSAVAALL